jgi:hypothetical protein
MATAEQQKKGLDAKRKWRAWTKEDDMVLRQIYPSTQSSVLVSILGRSIETIRVRASLLDIKRCTGAASSERSASAYRRYEDEDAVVYQPVIQKNEMSEAEFKRYELIATMKSNAQALNCAGMSWLASITGAIAEQIKSAKSLKKLGFLTIQDGI